MGGAFAEGASLFSSGIPETHRIDRQSVDRIAFSAGCRRLLRELPEFRKRPAPMALIDGLSRAGRQDTHCDNIAYIAMFVKMKICDQRTVGHSLSCRPLVRYTLREKSP
jgi:hypothetical protein